MQHNRQTVSDLNTEAAYLYITQIMPFSVARDETGKCLVNYKILGVKSADSVYNITKQIRQQNEC